MPTARKKMINIYILDILRKHSNADHPLSQAQIASLLKKEYNISVDRKAIKRNIDDLIDANYDITYNAAISRRILNPKTGAYEESRLSTDFYYIHPFLDGELRLLIDGVLASPYIHASHRKELIARLEQLTSKHFRSRMGYIKTISDTEKQKLDIFTNIERLDEALSLRKKVRFQYLVYFGPCSMPGTSVSCTPGALQTGSDPICRRHWLVIRKAQKRSRTPVHIRVHRSFLCSGSPAFRSR